MSPTNDHNSFLYANGQVHYGLDTPSVTASTFTGTTTEYDVVVIGAGFAGLCAARDISRSNKNVLLIEARDRIGGRTYTSPRHGYNVEMGGTWVHWTQPHVFHEIHQYGLQGELKRTTGTASPLAGGPEWVYFPHDGKLERMKNEIYEERITRAMKEFFNMDGDVGRVLLEFPHDGSRESIATKAIEKMSVADRLAEIKGKLPDDDIKLMAAFFGSIGCCEVKNISLYDAFKWWSLPGYDVASLFASTCSFKLKCGTTKLAQCILSEFQGETLFNSPVSSIEQSRHLVTLTTRTGVKVSAKQVVSTVPLNVLHSISFTPPLSPEKLDASKQGHINKGTKIHMYTDDRIPTFFTNAPPSSPILFGFSDDLPPPAGSFSVYFCQSSHLDGKDATSLAENFTKIMRSGTMVPGDLVPDEIMCHDWAKDEFARGVWCAFAPGYGGKWGGSLGKREGRVWFASGDWADGWRGFIDGAIEQGCRVARQVVGEMSDISTNGV